MESSRRARVPTVPNRERINSGTTAQSTDLSVSIELCCGPTSICGHHDLPDLAKDVDEATLAKTGFACTWFCRLIALGVVFAVGLVGAFLFKLRAEVFNDAPFYLKMSGIELSKLNVSLTKSELLQAYYDPVNFPNLTQSDVELYHCGDAVLRSTAKGGTEPSDCGIDADPYYEGCRAGYYQPRDPETGALDDAVDPIACPAGFFCLADVTCYIICAPGASCQPSRLSLPDPAANATTSGGGGGGDDDGGGLGKAKCVFDFPSTDRVDPYFVPTPTPPPTDPAAIAAPADDDAAALDDEAAPADDAANATGAGMTALCPGARSLQLCKAGSYCHFPMTNALCPDGYRCPLGVESPQKCTQFEQCRGEGHARGNAYSFAAALSGIVLVSFLFTGNFWAWIHRHIMLRKAIDRAQRAHGA